MDLKQYCKCKNISLSAFGRENGISKAQMSRWATGRLPKRAMMRKIALATQGLVLPNDFVDLAGVPVPCQSMSLIVVPTSMVQEFMPAADAAA